MQFDKCMGVQVQDGKTNLELTTKLGSVDELSEYNLEPMWTDGK